MTTSNRSGEFRVFPTIDTHHKNKPLTYFFIRVASRENGNKTFDIPLYYRDGVRVKINPKSFVKGEIKRSYYTNTEYDLLVDTIEEIYQRLKAFVRDKILIEVSTDILIDYAYTQNKHCNVYELLSI